MRTRAPLAAGVVSLLFVTLLVLNHSDAALRGSTASSGNQWGADQLQPPGTPTATYQCNLTVRSIRVDWSASSSSWATTYRVLRSVNGGAFSSAGTVSYGTNTWTDTSVNGSTTYTYRVRTERTGWSWVSNDTASSNSVSTPALCL